WSPGNESYGGENLAQVTEFFHAFEDRPVQYEGLYWDPRHPDTSDVASHMYTPAAEVEEVLQTHRDKPFILCEYAHAMGNSFGAVDKYTELAYREPLYQGGFIWTSPTKRSSCATATGTSSSATAETTTK